MGYKADSDWLDIALQSNMRRVEKDEPNGHRGVGFWFCPSPDILYPLLSKRKHGTFTDQDWLQYVKDYTAEMRASYRKARPAWDTLLSWERVVLLCMCVEAARCHRTILGQWILPKLGAEYRGEIAA
jgi:uncharacterized protein YeaO (DUF488 family)